MTRILPGSRYPVGYFTVTEPQSKMGITATEAKQWLVKFHEASASLNTTHWLNSCFSPKVTLVYANMPLIAGRDNVHLLFEAFLSRLEEMTHHIQSFDFIEQENKILQAASIVYRVKGDEEGKVVDIPGFAAFVLEKDSEGEIRLVRNQTWLDPSPVIERIVAVYGKEEWERVMGELMTRVGGG